MEAQNNNQPTLDNHNNLYKIPGQDDQVGYSTCVLSDSLLLFSLENNKWKKIVDRVDSCTFLLKDFITPLN